MPVTHTYRTILEDVRLMQLATSRGHRPWLCNVWFAADGDGHIYWISRETRRHSEDIAANAHVACTFHKWFAGGLGEKGQALVMAGTATRLPGPECRMPYGLYLSRYPALAEFQSLEAFLKDEGHHFFYRLAPTEIVLWDEINQPADPRQVIK